VTLPSALARTVREPGRCPPVSLLLSLLILVVANAVTITAMLYVRRRAPEGSYFRDGDRASSVFGMLATAFAIFAGFVLFLAFTTYDDSRNGAEEEALAVVQQFETAQYFPARDRDRLAGELICYARSVVAQEWAMLRESGSAEAVNPWGVKLFRTARALNPSTPAQQSAYDRWQDQTIDRESSRQDRIHGAAGIIPASVWIVLFLTAGVCFVFMLFFADSGEQRRSQAMLMGSATTVVVLTLLVISALDNPYGSSVGNIEPGAMKRTLSLVDSAEQALDERVQAPCDERGTAPAS
jgi:hypothetical protein